MTNRKRCAWAEGNEIMEKYHDNEWGKPVHDDNVHFEFLILEAAQAGLSWLTVLKKREGYRKAFVNFNVKKVATFTQQDVERLMKNPEIIRNRLKIESTITNAQAFINIQKEWGSFDKYLWNFVEGKPQIHNIHSIKDIPATAPLSDKVSKDLKKRGFRFVGSTIIYAHLQAVGIVNDHEMSCFCK